MLKDLPLSEIEFPEDIQPRVGSLDSDQVDDYAEATIRREPVPPIDVFEHDGRYISPNGRHRWEAVKKINRETISCRIHGGGLREAKRFALGANHDNGLPRTKADKSHQITMALTDPEWVVLTNREIARMCHVTHPTVLTIRRRLEKTGAIESQDKLSGTDGKSYDPVGKLTNRRKTAKKQRNKQDSEYARVSKEVRESLEREQAAKSKRKKPRTQREVDRDEMFAAMQTVRTALANGDDFVNEWNCVDRLAEFLCCRDWFASATVACKTLKAKDKAA